MMNQREEQIVHLHHSQIQDFFAIAEAIGKDFRDFTTAIKCPVLSRGDVAERFLDFWRSHKTKYQFPGYTLVTVKQIALEVVRYYYGDIANV